MDGTTINCDILGLINDLGLQVSEQLECENKDPEPLKPETNLRSKECTQCLSMIHRGQR